MSPLNKQDLGNAPDHGVLPSPRGYAIVGLNYRVADAPHATLDLTLEKNGSRLVLRFTGVRELEIDADFPNSYEGFRILDVGHMGWEHTRVRVQGAEDSCISFWAADVSRVEN